MHISDILPSEPTVCHPEQPSQGDPVPPVVQEYYRKKHLLA